MRMHTRASAKRPRINGGQSGEREVTRNEPDLHQRSKTFEENGKFEQGLDPIRGLELLPRRPPKKCGTQSLPG